MIRECPCAYGKHSARRRVLVARQRHNVDRFYVCSVHKKYYVHNPDFIVSASTLDWNPLLLSGKKRKKR